MKAQATVIIACRSGASIRGIGGLVLADGGGIRIFATSLTITGDTLSFNDCKSGDLGNTSSSNMVISGIDGIL